MNNLFNTIRKLLIIFSLLCHSAITNADLTIKTSDPIQDQIDLIQVEDKQIKFGKDILATALNYASFEVGLTGLVHQMRQYTANKDYEMLCAIHLMAHEFMVNNMKYSQEFNSKHLNLNYESLLNKLTQDNYDNKDGCTGKAYFYK